MPHYIVKTSSDRLPSRRSLSVDAAYQEILIEAIGDVHDGHPIYRDGQAGSIYVDIAGRGCVYATPGWEGDWTSLPIDMTDDECESIASRTVDFTYTGNPQIDARNWHTAVRAFLREVLA